MVVRVAVLCVRMASVHRRIVVIVRVRVVVVVVVVVVFVLATAPFRVLVPRHAGHCH